jgi:hypothetical protein
MIFNTLAYPAVILVAFTSLMLLVSTSWRWIILTLAFQYAGVFILVALRWPLEIAAAKIVAGWMASAVLGYAIHDAVSANPSVWQRTEKFSPSGRMFRLLTSGLVAITVLSISPRLVEWVESIGTIQAVGASTLIGMGLLHLGLTAQPFRVMIGLLTFLSGFEILIAAVDVSALVAGLAGICKPWISPGRSVFTTLSQSGGSILSAPLLWIFIPGLLAVLLFVFKKWEKATSLIGALAALVLAGLAWKMPLSDIISLGPWSFQFTTSISVLGRQLVLAENTRPILGMIYLMMAFWLGGAYPARAGSFFVPLGLGIVTLLTAAIAVKPFLYAALFIQIAAFMSVPLLSSPGKQIQSRGATFSNISNSWHSLHFAHRLVDHRGRGSPGRYCLVSPHNHPPWIGF